MQCILMDLFILILVNEMVWHHIETSPRNKEVFIGAFIDGEFKFGKSIRFYARGNDIEGEYWHGWFWSNDDVDESVAECPSHWMPLPEPQKE